MFPSPSRRPFTSQREQDPESALMHYRARSYDPRTGRFVQKDPVLELKVKAPYAYANLRPTDHRDPKGMQADPTPLVDWLAKPTMNNPGFTMSLRWINLTPKKEYVQLNKIWTTYSLENGTSYQSETEIHDLTIERGAGTADERSDEVKSYKAALEKQEGSKVNKVHIVSAGWFGEGTIAWSAAKEPGEKKSMHTYEKVILSKTATADLGNPAKSTKLAEKTKLELGKVTVTKDLYHVVVDYLWDSGSNKERIKVDFSLAGKPIWQTVSFSDEKPVKR